MYRLNASAWARSAYGERGWVLLPGYAPSGFVQKCLSLAATTPQDLWIPGDASATPWRELSTPELALLCQQLPLEVVPSILGREIASLYPWINEFCLFQAISAHCDAGGDGQLLMGLDVPESRHEGQFWLGSPDQLIPVGVGDLLVFQASRLQHGTTLIDRDSSAIRRTLNIRLWLTS